MLVHLMISFLVSCCLVINFTNLPTRIRIFRVDFFLLFFGWNRFYANDLFFSHFALARFDFDTHFCTIRKKQFNFFLNCLKCGAKTICCANVFRNKYKKKKDRKSRYAKCVTYIQLTVRQNLTKLEIFSSRVRVFFLMNFVGQIFLQKDEEKKLNSAMLVPAFERLCLYLDFRSVSFLLFCLIGLRNGASNFIREPVLHRDCIPKVLRSIVNREHICMSRQTNHCSPAIIHVLKISSSTCDNWIGVAIPFSPITVKQFRRSNRNALAILLSSMNWTMRFHHSTFEWFVDCRYSLSSV